MEGFPSRPSSSGPRAEHAKPTADDRRRGAEAYGENRSWLPPELAPVAEEAPHASYDFVTRDDRHFRVGLTAEPVFDLRRTQPTATYIRTRIRQTDLQTGETPLREQIFHPRDAERMETLEFRRGMALLQECATDLGVMPLSWRMASSPALAALSSGLREGLDPKAHIVAELRDIPAGVSRTTLRRIVHAVGDRRRAVCARVPAESEAVDAVANCGLRGVVFHVEARALQPEVAWLRFAGLIHAARQVFATVVVDGLPGERREDLVAAGATHALFARTAHRLI
jgi:hypothetical protein